MANQNFDINVQLDGTYVGDRIWSGDQMHSSWNVENMNTDNRSVWRTTTDGWLQYASLFGSYSMRYNALDISLQDTFFDTEMSPGGTGNYELGVMFRFKDRNNYYYITYNGGYQDWGGRNLRLMKRTSSGDIQLADYAIPVFNRTLSYRVRVEVVGSHIQVWMDGIAVFNYIDQFPISNGAFGPIVKAQEFARWKFFSAKSVSGFVVTKQGLGYEVPHTNYDAATSKLLFPETVSTYMEQEIANFLSTVVVDSYEFVRFIVTTTNPKTVVLFDKVPSKNITNDLDSRIYAFQILPTSPPTQVTGLQGSPIDHQSIKLQWTHADDSEDGYHIMDETNTILGSVGPNVFAYIQSGLSEGTTYNRQVVAFNSAGLSTPSNSVYVTTLETVPQPPDLFTGVALSDDKIEWSWADMSFNEGEFEILDLSGATPVVIRTLSKDTTSWIEEGLIHLTEYTRAIRSKNTAGHSVPSNTASAVTMDEMPDPPPLTPLNFSGVGVSHDSILWTWEDKNVNVQGFNIYDENGTLVIKTVIDGRKFTEIDLYSAMEYRRSIAAYNKGGEGPRTPFAWAKTLKYGEDQIGTPLEPFNLQVSDVTIDSAVLTWEYNGHELMPAIGFKVYNELDELVAVVPIGTQTHTVLYLTADTSYTMYVTAYNETGDSLPSNNIVWVTDKLTGPPVEEEPEQLPNEWIDPYYGIEYDMETENTPKIPAFHSGVGDNLDLVVHNLHNIIPNVENFVYEMYVKGGYEVVEEYYPEVPFKFQVRLTALRQDGTIYNDETEWVSGVIRGGDGGSGIRFDSAINMKPIPDDVQVSSNNYMVDFRDEENNPLPPQSAKMNWAFESKQREEKVGIVETIEMENVYTDWYKFSHNSSDKFPALIGEMDSWIYDSTTDEIVTTLNSSSYMGAISPDAYDNYDIDMVLRSSAADNDRMAFVLAFAIDESGREHTLSAVRNHENYQWDWGIFYNFQQSTQFAIETKFIGDLNDFNAWHFYYPKGTSINAIRRGDIFEARASMAGSDIILESSKITVDLSSDPRLAIFTGAKQIGVAAQSQDDAALKITSFIGEKTRIFINNFVTAWTDFKDTRVVLKEWKSAVEVSKEVTITEGNILEFEGRIQSPQYQIPWQYLSKSYSFNPFAYRLIVTSKNPNIKLVLLEEVTDFFPVDATFIKVKLKAQIINKDQTAWHPSIHSGYYYFNQRENFLYSNDRVLPKEGTDIKSYEYSFPYILRAYAERHYTGGDVILSDDTSSDFSKGLPDPGIKLSATDGTMSLKDSSASQMFVSRVLDFGRVIDIWNEPAIVQDEVAISDGAKTEIELGVADEVGNVSEWFRPGFVPAAERVRYRLSLKEGYRKEKYLGNFLQIGDQLSEGYIDRVIVGNSTIEIRDPELNHEGFLITRPIPIGTNIDEVGTVELDLTIPDGASVQLFSVTAMTATHRFDIPTSTEPWIPLRLKATNGIHKTYIIDSVPKPYLAIVARLIRSPQTPDMMAKSPLIDNMSVQSKLYNLIRVVPTIDTVSIGGYIPAGYWVEDYTVPLIGKLISDQSFHPITDRNAEEVVTNHLASIGVNDIENLTFKDYFAEVDPMYEVELKLDSYGKTPVEAETISIVGDIIYKQEKLYFDTEMKTVVVRPVPQNGSPIVIKNAQGKILKQTHFRNPEGKPTLYNTEDLETNETRNVFLQHHESEIEKLSMVVYIELEKNKWTQIFGSVIVQNRIVLPHNYLPFLNMRVIYRLKDTFYVDYNYSPKKDHALIRVNTSHDVAIKATTLLDIKYEVNKEHPYYIGEEINLNPLYNKISSGFVYLTDELYAPYRMNLICNPTTLYRSKHEKVAVHAYVYDENGNPVVGEKVSWEALHGGIEVKTYETDMNGMVTAIYEVPKDILIPNDTLTASVIGRKASSHLTKTIKLTIVEEKIIDKIAIVPEKHIVQSGDIVQLKIMAMGPSHERVMNKNITLTSNEGIVIPTTGMTDYNGELLIEYRHPIASTMNYIIIEASDGKTKEQVILGVSGV